MVKESGGTKLHEQRREIVDMHRDGSCFYHAIAYFYGRVYQGGALHRHHHKKIRKISYDAVMRNSEKQFGVPPMTMFSHFTDDLSNGKDMRDSEVWGNAEEIAFLMNAEPLTRLIELFQVDSMQNINGVTIPLRCALRGHGIIYVDKLSFLDRFVDEHIYHPRQIEDYKLHQKLGCPFFVLIRVDLNHFNCLNGVVFIPKSMRTPARWKLFIQELFQ